MKEIFKKSKNKECINDSADAIKEKVNSLNETELKCWYDAYYYIRKDVVDNRQITLNTEMNMFMIKICDEIRIRYKSLTGKDVD